MITSRGRKRMPRACESGSTTGPDNGTADCGGPKAAIVILRMGGNCAVARLCDVSSAAVSSWKKLGIPWDCMMILRKHAPLGWLASPLPEEAQATQHWPRILMSPKAFSRMQAWAGLPGQPQEPNVAMVVEQLASV